MRVPKHSEALHSVRCGLRRDPQLPSDTRSTTPSAVASDTPVVGGGDGVQAMLQSLESRLAAVGCVSRYAAPLLRHVLQLHSVLSPDFVPASYRAGLKGVVGSDIGGV